MAAQEDQNNQGWNRWFSNGKPGDALLFYLFVAGVILITYLPDILEKIREIWGTVCSTIVQLAEIAAG